MTTNEKSKNRKGLPPAIQQASLNLNKKDSDDKDNLFFWVSPEFKREYKIYAIERDMSMKDLLIQSFEEFKENHR